MSKTRRSGYRRLLCFVGRRDRHTLPRGVLIQNTVRLVGADGTNVTCNNTDAFVGRFSTRLKIPMRQYICLCIMPKFMPLQSCIKLQVFTQFDVDIDEIISNVEAQQGIIFARSKGKLCIFQNGFVITGPGTEPL